MNSKIEKQTFHSLNMGKVFFIYLIVVFHSRLLDGIVNHGYIGVEFFFIVSGYFLCKAVTETSVSLLDYVKKRVIKLYPHYILSFVIMLIVTVLVGDYQQGQYNLIAEILMIPKYGFINGGLNYPCWYMSVLFWMSLLLFLLLKYVPQILHIFVCVVLVVFYYGCSVLIFDGRTEIWDTFHGLYLPIFRGLADLSIGVVLYYIVQNFKSAYKHTAILKVVECISFFMLLGLVIYPFNIDTLTVALIVVWVFTAFSKDSTFEKIGDTKMMKWLSRYEYPIFLNHALVIMVFKKYIIGVFQMRVLFMLPLLLIVVTSYSVITTEILKVLTRKMKS